MHMILDNKLKKIVKREIEQIEKPENQNNL